ncbi:50S ribosomal protein L4p (L1e) [Candidatus Nasuia deltocephalinicola]|nr:50S ribosomal protein L4p (L1e) [Candidatus Nasuia deltocephalinicola]
MYNYIDCYGNLYFLNIKNFFNFSFNIKIIHNFLIFYKNNSRIGSRSQKNKSNINYSTRKIYKQKGTGRSRAGSLSSPIRRKGARSFPSFFFENFNQKFNKKNYKIIIFIIFSKFIKNNKFFFIDDFFFIKISTNFFIKKIKFLGFSKFTFILYKINLNFFLSQRNYFNSNLLNLFKINPILLIKYDKILFFTSSINYFYNL